MKMDFKDEDVEMGEMFGGKSKKRLMIMEDVSKELEKDFAEEIADSNKYFHMAKIAEKADCHEDCHYLTEMAKDEYTHAYFIYNFMIEHDIDIPEEQEKEFEKLKEKMTELF